MNYQQAIDYLYAQLPMFSRIGAAAYKPGLERVRKLSDFLGKPENDFPSVHIAGTNGKGSTSHIIASVLMAAGYKTALYTSPHLVDFRERIKIDGHKIPEKDVVEFVERWQKMDYQDDAPSFFELTMMMAFDWFKREKVDIAVIETGMGGRLDSTNIITPLLSVITNISPDHTQFLGHTLPEIAAEKAGIIKPGVPVVLGEPEPDYVDVFRNKAGSTKSTLIEVSSHNERLHFSLACDYSGWKVQDPELGDLFVDLAGDYQQKNIVTALEALKTLRSLGLDITDEAIRKGLAHAASSTGLMGRWMILARKPFTVCDTGHNIAGLKWNMDRLSSMLVNHTKLRILLGFVADKAIDEILTLLPSEAEYYVTNAAIPRALPAADLQEKMLASGFNSRVFPDVSTAYSTMIEDAADTDLLYVGGSTFIVADLLKDFQKEEK